MRTVVVERLVRRAAWLEVELHAVKGGGEQLRVATEARDAGTWRRLRRSPRATTAPSTCRRCSRSTRNGEVVHPGDFVAQYRYCLEQAGELLEPVGLSLDHAVTTFDYSTPDTRAVYRKTHRVRKELLGTTRPASTRVPAAS